MNIFYSWQSDIDNKYNRKFIFDSLKKIENDFKKDSILDIYIDQATRDEPGSPNISQTIFKKIDTCSIFICDVSIINKSEIHRKTPNPNVLIELGYAIKHIGIEKIICIFNNAFGIIEDLPFDIRQNRILQYEFIGENKDKCIADLVEKLKLAILTIDKKTISHNKIDLLAFDNSNRKILGTTIDTNKVLLLEITKDIFISQVNRRNILNLNSDDTNSWQSYLLKIIKDDEEKRIKLSEQRFYVNSIDLNIGENKKYFEEYLSYKLEIINSLRLDFMIKNNNDKPITNLKICFECNLYDNIIRYIDFSEEPTDSYLYKRAFNKHNESKYQFQKISDKIIFTYSIDILYGKEEKVIDEPLYILLNKTKNIEIKFTIYSVEIQPISGIIVYNIETETQTILVDDIINL